MTEEPENTQGRKNNYAYRQRREANREPGKLAKDGVLLDCPPLTNGRNSNFIQWSRQIQTLVGSKFSDMDNIWTAKGRTAAFKTKQKPVQPTAAELTADAFGLKKAQYLEEMKLYLKKERDLEETASRVYNYMKLHISPESWEEIKVNKPWKITEEVDERTIEGLRCPFYLFKAIKATHSGHRTGVGILDEEEASNAYTNVRQRQEESLHKYLEYFTQKVNTLSTLGLTVPSEEQQALKFIRGLDDSRYSELKTLYFEQTRAGLGSYPKTVILAYNNASNHRQAVNKKKKAHGVAYISQKATKENVNPNSNAHPKKKKGQPFCYVCPCEGHWTKDCPTVARAKLLEEPKAIVANMTIEKKVLVTILHSEYQSDSVGRYQKALDSAATAALMKEKKLLKHLRKTDQTAEITGVNGEVLSTNWIGDMKDGLGTAYYHPKAVANLVPFGRLEKMFEMNYERNKRFYLTNKEGKEISFNKVTVDAEGNGLYIVDYTADFEEKKIAAIATVEDNKTNYTRREVKLAAKAKEFLKNLAYPSINDAIKIIESGTLMDCPITPADIIRAHDIWGPDLASLKGKTVHKKLKGVKEDYLPKPKKAAKIQNLYADIMFLEKQYPYLITISQPLNMIMIKDLGGKRDRETVGDAIIAMAEKYKSRGFTIDKVFCDTEGGVVASKPVLNAEGIELDLSSAGEHVPIVERNIRLIKERMRAILSVLPYQLPQKLIGYLADYAAMMINSFPRPTSNDKISPREHFTGRKLNYSRDFRIAFGEYAQVIIPNIVSNDVRQPRTEGAIALLPTGNAHSSVLFYILRSGRIVSRDRFTVLPMPLEVIEKMQSLGGGGIKDALINLDEYMDSDDDDDIKFYTPPEVEDVLPDTEGLELVPENPNEIAEPASDPAPDESDIPSPEELLASRYNLRPTPTPREFYQLGTAEPVIRQAYYYGFRVGIKHALRNYPKEALDSIMKELKQMLDKGVFKFVKKSELTPEQIKKIIGSFMFLKEKFKANGLFEKLKARLVARGDMEFGTLMDISSPTASLQAVLMIAAIAAKECRHVKSADVPGAYLNALMEEEVHMMLDEFLTSLLLALRPELAEFVDENGRLTVLLEKAMYGCDESARLWYNTFSDFLISEGFEVNPVERCVFNKTYNGIQCTICLYVDDLLITCTDESIINQIITALQKRFPGIVPVEGKVHSYLGMLFDFTTPGEVKVTMEHYTKGILEQYNVEGKVNAPALPNLFEITESPLLAEKERKKFHSIVAALLYLAKRTRPDILTTVSFLSTRVTKATESDWKRLDRLLKYLNYDPSSGIVLKPGDQPLHINASIDASYGVHEDGKSHSGLCIALGDGPVFVRSAKQKIVSKSSTEAELIGISDGCSQIIWSRDFIIGQGYDVSAATVYQDNMSTINMVKAGKPTSDRSRHIHVRYFFIKDRVDSGEIAIQYMPTDEMTADILTKPLVGEKFRKLKAKLLNWYY